MGGRQRTTLFMGMGGAEKKSASEINRKNQETKGKKTKKKK